MTATTDEVIITKEIYEEARRKAVSSGFLTSFDSITPNNLMLGCLSISERLDGEGYTSIVVGSKMIRRMLSIQVISDALDMELEPPNVFGAMYGMALVSDGLMPKDQQFTNPGEILFVRLTNDKVSRATLMNVTPKEK